MEKTLQEKQTTSRQLIAIVFIASLATKLFLLPVFLLRSGGRDGYIALAVFGGIDLISLGLWLAAIKLAGDGDFFTIISSAVGKIGAKIVAALVGLYMFFKLNIAVAEILTFYTDNVFSDFTTPIMAVALLVFLVAAGKHTLRSLARLNELLVPLIVASIVILVTIVVVTRFDIANVLPALRDVDGFKDALTRHAVWLGDFTPLALFVGRTEIKKHTAAISVGAAVIGTAAAVFFCLAMCAAFGNVPNLADSSTNLSNILQFSLGNVYGRVDLFSSVLWSVAAFIEAALLFYASSRCFSFVCGRPPHIVVAVIEAAALYVLQVFLMTDPTVFAAVARSVVSSAVSLCFAVLTPLLTVLFSRAGGRVEKEEVTE